MNLTTFPHANRLPPRGAALIALTLASAMLAGCTGSDGEVTAFTPVDGAESAYCDIFRSWQVHELAGDGDDQPNPAALRKYWNEYLEFNETSLQQAPQVIRDEWVVSERGVRTVVTPVLEKYDFDLARIAREGSAAEQAVAEPPPDVRKAQDAIHAYEDRVCGTASAPAADVVFEADGSSKRYCAAASAFNGGFEKVESSRFDQDVMRSVFTADRFSEGLDALEASAPVAIAADIEAVTEWFRTRWSDVIADFEYDIRRIWLDGTAEDRAVFNFFHPDIVEHDTRVTAYDEQVCTG